MDKNIPAFAAKQLDGCRRGLEAMASRWQATATIPELWVDPQKSVFATMRSNRTCAALFGGWIFRGGKAAAQFARTRKLAMVPSCRPRIRRNMTLPRDAVILLLHENKRGVVVASAEEGLVAFPPPPNPSRHGKCLRQRRDRGDQRA